MSTNRNKFTGKIAVVTNALGLIITTTLIVKFSLIGTIFICVGEAERLAVLSDSKLRTPNAEEKKKIRNIVEEFKDYRGSVKGPLGFMKNIASDDLTKLE